MRSSQWLRAAVLGAAALLSSLGAGAQDIAPRLALCGACHGVNGQSQTKDTPSLAAQPRVFLENQLVLIREGMRDIPAMKGVLEGVTDAEIAALARHYAAQAPRPPEGPRDAALFDRGRQAAGAMRCGICHLPNYVGREQVPRVAGQREDYLLHSMRQFRAGQAVGRDTIMAASLYGVGDDDLRALAHFMAHVVP